MSFYDAFKTAYDTPITVDLYLHGEKDKDGNDTYTKPWLDASGKSASVSLYSLKSAVSQQFDKNLTHKQKSGNLTNEERTEVILKRLTALTAGWYLPALDDSEDLQFSPEEAARLYRDVTTQFIALQLIPYVNDDARFLDKKSSAKT